MTIALSRPAHVSRVIVCAVATAALVGLVACSGTPRSEAWMRGHFRTHRAEFDLAVRMANEDFVRTRVVRIAPEFTRLEKDWSWPRPEAKWGITRQRWSEYRSVFRSLQLPAGLDRGGGDNSAILFMVFGVGMAGEGTEYGFLWSPREPEQIDRDGEHFHTKPLDAAWYIYEWQT